MGEQLVLKARNDQARRNALGRDAEARAVALNRVCESQRVARLRRLFPECYGAPGKMTPKAAADADYYGCMLDGSARAVLVECKHVDGERFSFANLREPQQKALEALDAAGGVAVVLVVATGRDYALPWWLVRDLLARDLANVRLDALGEYRVIPGDAYLARWARKGGVR